MDIVIEGERDDKLKQNFYQTNMNIMIENVVKYGINYKYYMYPQYNTYLYDKIINLQYFSFDTNQLN